jgi:hypothetical protein
MEKDNTRKEGWIRLPVMDDNGFFAAMNDIGKYFILYMYFQNPYYFSSCVDKYKEVLACFSFKLFIRRI